MTEKLHIFLHFIFFLSLFSRNTAFLTFDRSENRSIIGSNDKLEQVTSNNTYIRITDLAIKPAIRE